MVPTPPRRPSPDWAYANVDPPCWRHGRWLDHSTVSLWSMPISGEPDISGGDDSPASRPLTRTTLSDRVADEILEDIYAQGLAAGAVIPPEGELAKTFGVSRIVVREAVRMLVAREVLDSGQGRPARVREPSSKVLTQLFEHHLRLRNLDHAKLIETRRVLEGQLAADAADAVASGALTTNDMADALAEMGWHADDMESFLKADLRFHHALGELAQNPVISLILDGLDGLLMGSRRLSYQGNAHRRMSLTHTLDEHERVLRSVESGDPVTARREMEALVQRTLENVLALTDR